MAHDLSRRGFLAASAAAGLGLVAAARAGTQPFRTTLHKAMIVGTPTAANLQPLKDAGFEGVEASPIAPEQAARAREAADKLGMRIHSVLRGWVGFNGPNPEGDIASVAAALRSAQAYGADAVLLVPCRIGGMPMPQPWEFDIEFDEKTGHVTRVAAGDNERFRAYIEAQNLATDRSREALRRLLPVAEETRVAIALENVWNNLWVKPALFRWFVASLGSPWVKAYYDVGNHVKYAPAMQDGQLRLVHPPEEWIRILGPLLAKIHIKDFRLPADLRGGTFVHPRDGSVAWPAVRQALDRAGYNGWLTIEDGGLPLAEFNQRLDLIIAGR